MVGDEDIIPQDMGVDMRKVRVRCSQCDEAQRWAHGVPDYKVLLASIFGKDYVKRIREIDKRRLE